MRLLLCFFIFIPSLSFAALGSTCEYGCSNTETGSTTVTGTTKVYVSQNPNCPVASGQPMSCEDVHVPSTGSYYYYTQRFPSGVENYFYCDKTTVYVSQECNTEPPPPTEPATCNNGTKDGDETGIDCGGPCSASCIEACPPGSSIEMRDVCNADKSICTPMPHCIGNTPVPAAPGGACPPASGDVLQYLKNSDGTCSPWVGLPALSAAGDGDGLIPAVDVPDPADAWLPTPGNETTVTESPPQVVNNPDGSTTETASKTEVTKSPDGTQIATTGSVSTTTNADGSKSTVETKDTVRTGSDGSVSRSTTTTTSSYDAGGNLIGKSTSTVKGGDGSGLYDPGEGDASNYSPVAAAGVPDGIGDQIGSLLTDFSNNIKGSPVFSLGSRLFAGPPSSSSAPVAVLDFGSYGEFSFDLSDYDTDLNVLGMIFVAMTFFASLKLIMVNKG